jgi:membrane protease YdiL (CAAX protease family)
MTATIHALDAPTTSTPAATSVDRPPIRHRLARRWPITTFLVLAAVLSWWPALGRFDNPDAALVIPIGPSIAGLLVVGWRDGASARRALRRSAFTFRGQSGWRALLIPVVAAGTAVIAGLATGVAAPTPASIGSSLLILALIPFTAVVSGPLGEELGWRGFLLPHLLGRHSAIAATLRIIPIWVLFHLPLMVTESDRRGWWIVSVAGMSIALTWLHQLSGGSIALAIVFHAAVNSIGGAAIQLFDEAHRQAAWIGWSTVWVVAGIALVAGPLRRSSAAGGAS